MPALILEYFLISYFLRAGAYVSASTAEGVHNDDMPRAGQGQQSDAPSFSLRRSSCGAIRIGIFRAHCAVSVHIEVDGTTLGRQVQPMSDKMGPGTCVAPSIWVWFASTSSTCSQPDLSDEGILIKNEVLVSITNHLNLEHTSNSH